MDLSSLPEAQKQQLQQLQQQFQEHQQQQQTQYYAQDYASSQQYDPSQIQTQPSYDQSYYSYYQQNPQHSQQSQPQPPQQYDYYSNAYQHQEQHFSQPESVGHTKSVGISEAPLPAGESGGTAWLGQGQVQLPHQQNAYYPQQAGPGGDQLNSGFSGMNLAAAVAALSQLTQFAGTMGSTERAMVELQGYRPMMGRGVPGQFMGPGTMHYGGPSIGQYQSITRLFFRSFFNNRFFCYS